MPEDIELLRLKAKAKLKFEQEQTEKPMPDVGVFETAFPGVTEAKGLKKIPAAIGDIFGGIGQLPSALPHVAKAAFTKDPEKKRELALKARTALRGESPGFARSILESPGFGAGVAFAPLTGGMSLFKAGALESGAGAIAEQAKRIGQDKPVQPIRAAAETAVGTALPFGLSKGGPALARGVNKLVGKTTEGFSGVTQDALRKFGTGLSLSKKGLKTSEGAKQLKEAFETRFKIAEDLVDVVDNAHRYMPEELIIKPALEQIQNVPTQEIYEALAESVLNQRATSTARDQMSRLIDDISSDFGTHVNGLELRDLRIRLDKEIGDKFGEAASDFVEGVKKGRKEAQNLLIENSPDDRVAAAFASESNKFSKIDALKQEMGKTSAGRKKRAETFVNTLFGANKTLRRQRLEEFQEIFGEDFMARSELARMAASLGDGGTPGILPQSFTGRSLLGLGVGSQVQQMAEVPLLPALIASLSSPRVGAGVLSLTDLLEKGASNVAPKIPMTPVRRMVGASFLPTEEEKREQAIERAANGGN